MKSQTEKDRGGAVTRMKCERISLGQRSPIAVCRQLELRGKFDLKITFVLISAYFPSFSEAGLSATRTSKSQVVNQSPVTKSSLFSLGFTSQTIFLLIYFPFSLSFPHFTFSGQGSRIFSVVSFPRAQFSLFQILILLWIS